MKNLYHIIQRWAEARPQVTPYWMLQWDQYTLVYNRDQKPLNWEGYTVKPEEIFITLNGLPLAYIDREHETWWCLERFKQQVRGFLMETARKVLKLHQDQERELERVCASIGGEVLRFCRLRLHRGVPEFHLAELEEHLNLMGLKTTPGSGGRILRMLRRRGLLDYRVINRSQSLYQLEGVVHDEVA